MKTASEDRKRMTEKAQAEWRKQAAEREAEEAAQQQRSAEASCESESYPTVQLESKRDTSGIVQATMAVALVLSLAANLILLLTR